VRRRPPTSVLFAAAGAALFASGSEAEEVLLIREACETEVASRSRTPEAVSLDRMFDECERYRAASSTDEARAALASLAGSGFCVLGDSRFGGSSISAAFCANPTAEACLLQASGNVLDSECRMWISNARAYSGTHELQTSRCRIGRDRSRVNHRAVFLFHRERTCLLMQVHADEILFTHIFYSIDFFTRACLKTLPYLRGACSACEALVSTSMCCKHISVSDSASRRRTPAARRARSPPRR